MSGPSGTTGYVANRDEIINRAFRIIGAIGQGETGNANAITEANVAINHLVKEWQADGMQLWQINELNFSYTAGKGGYLISLNATGTDIAQQAPNKIIQAWNRNTVTNYDQPIRLITRTEYELLGDKSSPGTPNQLFYVTPGPPIGTVPQMNGILNYYVVPDANAASTLQAYITGIMPLDDFDASTDLPDFPSYYYNALSWGLADQLAYEYGVPVTRASMIEKKADKHLMKALSYGAEEGSLLIQPDWESWQNSTTGGDAH